ncbi:MAG: hypothetical protein ACFFC7_28000 [Candidatus Hermodarchaeota archaeon]
MEQQEGTTITKRTGTTNKSNFISEWFSFLNLVKAFKSFEIVESDTNDLVLSPLKEDYEKELETLLTEGSFLAGIRVNTNSNDSMKICIQPKEEWEEN